VLNFNPQNRPTFSDIKNEANLNQLIQRAKSEHHKKVVESKGNTLLVMS